MPDHQLSTSPTIFVSAATSEFRSDRRALKELLDNYAAVHVQEDYPTSLYSGNKIAELIEKSDLIICLVGNQYGWPFPPDNRPADAVDGCSWTQWEYYHAREVIRQNPDKRLVVFMKNQKPEEVDPRQETFRQAIYAAEERTTDGLFFAPYVDQETLLATVKNMIEDPAGGFAKIQYAYWLGIKEIYRRKTVERWQAAMPHSYTLRTDAAMRQALMREPDPPFIETRGFSILNPKNDRQLEFLRPAAFITGFDSNAKADARRDADWRSVGSNPASGIALSDGNRIIETLWQPSDSRVVLGGVEVPQPIRLFIVSGSGIGKSATLSWIEARLNGLPSAECDRTTHSPRLAIMVLAGDLEKAKSPDLSQILADHMLQATGIAPETWHRRAVQVGLKQDAGQSNIVLIIDGLDHISNDLPLLLENQGGDIVAQRGWALCPAIVAGRPQALLNWRDRPGPGGHLAATHWRFIEPAEFTAEEAEVFLGNFETHSRMSVVEEHLAGLLHVPRILEYVRTLSAAQLKGVRTAADIYFAAVQQLVRSAMKSPAARVFGPDWQLYQDLQEPHQSQTSRMLAMLSALAFVSLCRTIDPYDRLDSYEFKVPLDDRRKERLLDRLRGPLSDPAMSREDLERDLRAVAAMSSVIGNGLLEELSAQDSTSIDNIMWANRTVQQFFAALWLSRYADGTDAVRALLLGGAMEVSQDATYDAQRARHYVFFPEADITGLDYEAEGGPAFARTDTTYEFNLFLAEMPRSAINPKSWVAAASAWYDPRLLEQEAGALRLWSSEMLYRSWPTMLHYANERLDDWWDTPYDRLAKQPPGRVRDAISLHRDTSRYDADPQRDLAPLVLQKFLGDFETILAGQGPPGSDAVAQEMIAPEQWIVVPEETNFMMGTPSDAPQGCPTGKVDAYWKHELLDRVQTRASTPLEAAEIGTWREWFAPGEVGRKGRETDVQWLSEVLEPLAEEGEARGLTEPDPDSPAYRLALEEIEARFKTSDETPAENPQRVRTFEMHRFPVLHRWFRLFAPGHRLAVEAYLAGIDHLDDAEPFRRLDGPPEPPPDDHPVIYTSWFDAWAFCQWATWHQDGKRYGLRLPHEPEWEFAARWTTEGNSRVQSKREWRWWWGNDFYVDETSLDTTSLPGRRAHADGRPGKTRAPAEAEPNGLGFHDILGNVWEWNANLYNEQRERDIWNQQKFTLRYSRLEPKTRPPVNGQRTMRGGLWYYLSILATCANRFRYVCNDRDFKIGFRVVREPRQDRERGAR